MKITEFTKRALAWRKQKRDLEARGYELIGTNGHPLLEMHNGGRYRERIIDAIISVDGKSVYIKTEEKP